MSCCAVETLHDQLRDCVDLMGIGLGAPRAQDTVAEEGTAITKDQPKDVGDVRSVHPAECHSALLYTTPCNCMSSAMQASVRANAMLLLRPREDKQSLSTTRLLLRFTKPMCCLMMFCYI